MDKYIEEIGFLKDRIILINQEIENIKKSYFEDEQKYKRVLSEQNTINRLNQSANLAMKLAKLYDEKKDTLKKFMLKNLLKLLGVLIAILIIVLNMPILIIPASLFVFIYEIPSIKKISNKYQTGQRELIAIQKDFYNQLIVGENHIKLNDDQLTNKIKEIIYQNNLQYQTYMTKNNHLFYHLETRDNMIKKLVAEKSQLSTKIGQLKALIIKQNPHIEFSSNEYIDENNEFNKRLKLEFQGNK